MIFFTGHGNVFEPSFNKDHYEKFIYSGDHNRWICGLQ